ncbi:MAG TPA: ABC transporter permease [Solirubrobacteraceae bacterium]|nr:ABC transporter permease [Solirubrobacteraceae bacterium]
MARQGLRARRRRLAVTAIGVALAAAMLSAAVVVSYGLGTGFSRAASAASLPDLLVRFSEQPGSRVVSRIRALPDVSRWSLRLEATNVELSFGAHSSSSGVAEVLNQPGPDQGYALVGGHQLGNHGRQVLVERGVAAAWGIRLGQRIQVGGLGSERVVGFAEGPDDVGYPLAAPRIYLSRPALDVTYGARAIDPRVNLAEIWLRNPAYVNQVLAQARTISYGLSAIRFATRSGVQILLDQAAGIVIDLLVALSVIALVTAGVLLAASARAEVQRRLTAIGVRRALGETRGQVTLAQVIEALGVSLPAGTVGAGAGLAVTYGASARLLMLLNEPAPGWSLWLPLGAAWLAAILLPAAGAAWPAWRAAGGSVVGLLRGGDLAGRSKASAARRHLPAGLVALGGRLAATRRARLLATVLTLGLSVGFVLLMLALASELSTLQTDPGALGKRYQLTASLPPPAAGRVRRIAGVQAVAPRYEVQAADSFELGETVDVIAYPGDHTVFEAPPLVTGGRLHGTRQAEVGEGLAEALGLGVGSQLALALPDGRELRLRVSGVVSSLDHDGRVAYVPATTLLRADPSAGSQLAVVVAPGASVSAVDRALTRLGAAPAAATGATGRGLPLVNVLRAILRAVAVVDGLVCLYALIQACSLTVQEQRRTLAVLRAVGAGGGAVARLLVGAVLTLIVPAAVLGVVLEELLFGPELSRLAINYAVLDLGAGVTEVLAVLAGLGVAAAVAVAWVSREAARESVVRGLAT